MNTNTITLKEKIDPYRQEILHHKVYAAIKTIEDLQVFMQYHVYAVWDFMSLLKSLQNQLTCTKLPWFPVGNADTRYLINEIVTGEESDLDIHGKRKSHFEMYLDAMLQCGAATGGIQAFIQSLRHGSSLEQAFEHADSPLAARYFTGFTFETIKKSSHVQAAVFTFGREDLIPGMFMSIINDMHQNFPAEISSFKYYLDRHIEVDGDHHSHLALQMTANLCGEDDRLWQEATGATITALQKRIQLWDGVYETIKRNRLKLKEADSLAG